MPWRRRFHLSGMSAVPCPSARFRSERRAAGAVVGQRGLTGPDRPRFWTPYQQVNDYRTEMGSGLLRELTQTEVAC